MAKLLLSAGLFITLLLNLVLGSQVQAVPYDYSYTHECLAKPLGHQYNGGIIVNPELEDGLNGWRTFGDAKINHLLSEDGNKFIVASNRTKPFHSFAQTFHLDKDKLYTFSAWLQVSHENADVAALFKTQSGYETAGWTIAKNGCWSMLKGGLVVNVSGPAHLYFECNNTKVDIWADSISLQPFTQEEWKSHQDESIEQSRKKRVKLQAVDEQGRPIANASVSLVQTNSYFNLGCAINKNILQNRAYQSWFSSRFKFTVFEGHFKYANLPYIRSAIDTLARYRMPMWVTELDVAAGPNQASYLEQILGELRAHQAVQGIMIWGAWSPQGCYAMCLTDNNFKNLATGDVVDRFRNQLSEGAHGVTDAEGFFEASMYHGEYEAMIIHPDGVRSSKLHKFDLKEEMQGALHFNVRV